MCAGITQPTRIYTYSVRIHSHYQDINYMYNMWPSVRIRPLGVNRLHYYVSSKFNVSCVYLILLSTPIAGEHIRLLLCNLRRTFAYLYNITSSCSKGTDKDRDGRMGTRDIQIHTLHFIQSKVYAKQAVLMLPCKQSGLSKALRFYGGHQPSLFQPFTCWDVWLPTLLSMSSSHGLLS